jgi:hypothetical protein
MTLHRIAAGLLLLGTLGHTLGGMLGTTRKGAGDAAADAVLASMKSVHFKWQGADCTWYAFAMGNGLSVSALLLFAVVALFVLGGVPPETRRALLPVAWAGFGSVALLGVLGFRCFALPVGAVFSLIAILCGIEAVRWTLAG